MPAFSIPPMMLRIIPDWEEGTVHDTPFISSQNDFSMGSQTLTKEVGRLAGYTFVSNIV